MTNIQIRSYQIGTELLQVAKNGTRQIINGQVLPFRYDPDGRLDLQIDTPQGPVRRRVRPVILAPCIPMVVIPDLLHDGLVAQGLPNAWIDEESGLIFAFTSVEFATLNWAVGRLFAQ